MHAPPPHCLTTLHRDPCRLGSRHPRRDRLGSRWRARPSRGSSLRLHSHEARDSSTATGHDVSRLSPGRAEIWPVPPAVQTSRLISGCRSSSTARPVLEQSRQETDIPRDAKITLVLAGILEHRHNHSLLFCLYCPPGIAFDNTEAHICKSADMGDRFDMLFICISFAIGVGFIFLRDVFL